ncbi:MAG: HAD family hydrolase [Pseudomonadota bacterium]
MQLSAILFDKDGTLFDFNRTWAAVAEQSFAVLAQDPALQNRLAELGGFDRKSQTFTPGAPMVAGTLDDIAELWLPHLPGQTVEGIARLLDDVALQATQQGALVPAIDGFVPFLQDLRAMGYRLGIATHDSYQSTIEQISAVGAREQFDFIAGYDSGYGMKPGPGMLLSFAKTVSVPPAEVVMVGDSVGDLKMVGNAGGALAIGVLSGPARAADLAPYADHVVTTIAEIPTLLRGLSG